MSGLIKISSTCSSSLPMTVIGCVAPFRRRVFASIFNDHEIISKRVYSRDREFIKHAAGATPRPVIIHLVNDDGDDDGNVRFRHVPQQRACQQRVRRLARSATTGARAKTTAASASRRLDAGSTKSVRLNAAGFATTFIIRRPARRQRRGGRERGGACRDATRYCPDDCHRPQRASVDRSPCR